MELKDLKALLRIDGDDMDPQLQLYQSAAEEYLTGAGVAKNYSRCLYKVAVSAFVGLLIDNPNLVTSWRVEGDKLGVTLNGLIAQLRS